MEYVWDREKCVGNCDDGKSEPELRGRFGDDGEGKSEPAVGGRFGDDAGVRREAEDDDEEEGELAG